MATRRNATRPISTISTDLAGMIPPESIPSSEEVLAESDKIILSERDFDTFVAAITGEPGPPSPALLDAVAVYKKHE